MAGRISVWTPELLRAVPGALRKAGNVGGAARLLGVTENSLRSAFKQYRIDYRPYLLQRIHKDIKAKSIDNIAKLHDEIRSLRAQVIEMERYSLDERKVREEILGLTGAVPDPPEWLVKPTGASHGPGVPTLFASDWHFGEMVDPAQINGVNSYDLRTGQKRVKAMVMNAVDILTRHMVNPRYPGMVFAVGGDMLSGDIHEELTATNEMEIGPVFVELYSVMVWVIKTLADTFKRVYVPWVCGNHSRLTHKPRNKGRAYTNLDWILGQVLEKHFAEDRRVQFNVSPSPDIIYRIYNHRYLLTHGDQFRGGNAIVGALGPVIWGDVRKRRRAMQIGQHYDTAILGHWHQWTVLPGVIINGSLVGYNEYAFHMNFPFSEPKQGLWLTHPTRGITVTWPVFLEPPGERKGEEWVSWT